MHLLIRLTLFLTTLFSIISVEVYAEPLTWTISNSSHLQGSFKFDPDTSTYSDFNVTSIQTNKDFSVTITSVDFNNLEPITEPSEPLGTSNFVQVLIADELTVNPGSIDLNCVLLEITFNEPLIGGNEVSIVTSQETIYPDIDCAASPDQIFAFNEGLVNSMLIPEFQVPISGLMIFILALLLVFSGIGLIKKPIDIPNK